MKKYYRRAVFHTILKGEDQYMQKRIILIGLFFTFALMPLLAGDVANFINLGFSEDSSVFMFGQYGVENGEEHPYAEIFTVHVPENDFIPQGVLKETFSHEIEAGQDGLGALLNLLHDAEPLVQKYNIDHLSSGRIVYIHLDGDKPKDRIEFRDFMRGDSYVLTLIQQRFGNEPDVSASFHINLAVTTKESATRTYTLGLPDYKRQEVMSYRIKAVYFSPAESGLVVIVEKEMWSEEGRNIRFMVETVPLGK